MREFGELALLYAGLDYRRQIMVRPDICCPPEVKAVLEDATKARNVLGWRHQTGFRALVWEILKSDCRRLGTSKE